MKVFQYNKQVLFKMTSKFRPLFSQTRLFKKSVAPVPNNGLSKFNQKNIIKSLMFAGSSSLFCWYNSEYDPITSRRRLNILSAKNREEWAKMTVQTFNIYPAIKWTDVDRWMEWTKKTFGERLIDALIEENLRFKEVSKGHPAHERIGKIVEQIIETNSDLNLSAPIIHLTLEGAMNAYSLANHIIICADGLDLLSDDQLSFIIAHEMAHHMLDHHMEGLSWMVVEMMTALFFFLVSKRKFLFVLMWVILKPFKLGIVFPIKRIGEFEADDIGLEMSMKAGGNPRDVMIFWDLMEILKPDFPGSQFVSDHPLHADRKQRMDRNITTIFDKLFLTSTSPELMSKVDK